MTANSTVSQSIAVADPLHPDHVIKPNADGSINITGSIAAVSAAVATAAAPTYSEGVSEPLSQDLAGNLRITGSISATNPSVSATGSAVPASATYSGMNVSGNLTGLVGTANGLKVDGSSATFPATQSGTWNIATVTTITTITGVTSAFGATGATIPANAVQQGFLCTSNPTAVSPGQLVGAQSDKFGRQVVVLGNIRDNKANQRTALSSSSETTVVTAVASTFLDVYGVIAANTTASGVNLTFKDSTGGTTQFDLTVPANDTRGFMLPSSDAFKQSVVNNNWTCTGGASGVNIDVLFVKNT